MKCIKWPKHLVNGEVDVAQWVINPLYKWSWENLRTTKAQISLHIHCLDSFCCLDSIISLVSVSEISSLYLVSVTVRTGLSLPWSQIPKTGFLVTWLKLKVSVLILGSSSHSDETLHLDSISITQLFIGRLTPIHAFASIDKPGMMHYLSYSLLILITLLTGLLVMNCCLNTCIGNHVIFSESSYVYIICILVAESKTKANKKTQEKNCKYIRFYVCMYFQITGPYAEGCRRCDCSPLAEKIISKSCSFHQKLSLHP